MADDNKDFFQAMFGGKSKKETSQERNAASVTLALALAAAVKKIFKQKADKKLSSEPLIEKKLITQFVNRMRIDGMEKFNRPTVLSVVHFYKNAAQMEKNKPVGELIVYVAIDAIGDLMHLLKYPPVDEDEEDEVKDACGTLCNVIAGYFRKEMVNLGYVEPEMSHFTSFINTVVDGIEYDPEEIYKFEISFDVNGEKRLVTEMVMGALPRVKQPVV